LAAQAGISTGPGEMMGNAGPGMLADTIVKRWQDHMPLNRLEDMYARGQLSWSDRSEAAGFLARGAAP